MLEKIELGEIQQRFAEIVWENEPVSSGKLVKICEERLNWKKPTTYTVLRKLCEKGLLQNRDGIVTSLVPREEFYSAKSEQITVVATSKKRFIRVFLNSMERRDNDAPRLPMNHTRACVRNQQVVRKKQARRLQDGIAAPVD